MLRDSLRQAYQQLPEPRATIGFSTEIFLASLRKFAFETNITLNGKDFKIIDRLCKKVEVPKRLVIGYTRDLATTENSSPVATEYAYFFVLLISVLAQDTNDLKFLNCVLKIADGCLQAPVLTLTKEIQNSIHSLSDYLLLT